MKKYGIALLLIMFVSTMGLAQDDPIPPKRSRAFKVGGLGGFIPAWLFTDLKPINDMLTSSGGAAVKGDGMFLYGGGGAAYIMFVPNLRVGGFGLSGSVSSTSLKPGNIRRDAEVSISFSGVTVEYVIPVVDRLDIAIGTSLGGGGVDITLRQDVGSAITWVGEWNNFGSGNFNHTGNQIGNITRKHTGSFFVWVPSLSIEYAFLNWMGLRVGASYVGMSAPSWKLDEKYELLGVPNSVSGKGLMINAGLFIGTFQ